MTATLLMVPRRRGSVMLVLEVPMMRRLGGLLALAAGMLAWPCHASERCAEACASEGRCHWWAEGGECIAMSEERCRSSEGCASEGRCTLDLRNGVCTPQSEADCRGSRACLDRGSCSLDASRQACVPRSDEDCRQSRDCQLFDACYLDEKAGRCDDGHEVANRAMAIIGGAHAAAGIVGMAISPVGAFAARDIRATYAMIGLGAVSLGVGLPIMIVGLQPEPREGVELQASLSVRPTGLEWRLRF